VELNLFRDLIDLLGKVAAGLQTILNLPKAGRETICRALDDTYTHPALRSTIVITRLGDDLLPASDDDFLCEAARLDNYNEWMQAEREFRLHDWKGCTYDSAQRLVLPLCVFMKGPVPLVKLAALYLDKPTIRDPVGASKSNLNSRFLNRTIWHITEMRRRSILEV
jgi:hypothetical protein